MFLLITLLSVLAPAPAPVDAHYDALDAEIETILAAREEDPCRQSSLTTGIGLTGSGGIRTRLCNGVNTLKIELISLTGAVCCDDPATCVVRFTNIGFVEVFGVGVLEDGNLPGQQLTDLNPLASVDLTISLVAGCGESVKWLPIFQDCSQTGWSTPYLCHVERKCNNTLCE